MGRPRKHPEVVPSNVPDAAAPVREQIKQMTGFQSEEEMAEQLPENTLAAAPEDEKPKRKRRTKAEIEATRAVQPTDPNLSDPKYVKAIAEMQAFGGPSLVKGAFATVGLATGDPAMKLDAGEESKLDGYFYVMGKQYNVLDPSKHWFTMAIYFFGMLGSFIIARVMRSKGNSLQKQLARWFKGESEEVENEEKE